MDPRGEVRPILPTERGYIERGTYMDRGDWRYTMESHGWMPDIRRAVAEAWGTFIVVFVAAFPAILGDITGKSEFGSLGHLSTAFVTTALIYCLGQVSGAHFNPAVTLGFALRGVFEWYRALFYWACQFFGGFLAGCVLYGLFGHYGHVGATLPQYGLSNGAAFGIEIMLSAFLVFVTLNVATRANIIGAHAALPVGAIIAADVLVAGDITGASMNPARSLGPAVFAGGKPLDTIWIYLVAPFIGSIIAVILTFVMAPSFNPKEEDLATGRGESVQTKP